MLGADVRRRRETRILRLEHLLCIVLLMYSMKISQIAAG